MKLPILIQGGMGAGVSGWRLAQAVSRLGQLGVIAGTALDEILARRLQDGDPEGRIRHALAQFPFPAMSRRILERYFLPGGRPPGVPYLRRPAPTMGSRREMEELCIAGNFVEVFLAREGHTGPVGVNYLEKIPFPHLPSLYGALLAGVAVVLMGAGIPDEIPAAIRNLVEHRAAAYPLRVAGAKPGAAAPILFDPADHLEGPGPALAPPAFLPIISSTALARVLIRRTGGDLAGFVVEGPSAGGHNAPPRGPALWAADGQPVYGDRDAADLVALRGLGPPFWLAGGYGSPEGLRRALESGAAGIQVGTAFALCRESGLRPELRLALVRKALEGTGRVFTDPRASPTGFPFKVARLEGTLSEAPIYDGRRRVCDLGYLREPYSGADGRIGFRCPAEPLAAYLAKGGTAEEAAGRHCLCNSLVANIGMPQLREDGALEKPLVTLGDDLACIRRFCPDGNPDYSAETVVRALLGPRAAG